MADPAPFQLTCTPAVPELLKKLSCTIALSTYQAGKLVFISAASEERLVQLPRTFARPMAMVKDGNRLVLSTASTIELFIADKGTAPEYPNQPSTYDTLYLPRQTYQTGQTDTHGLDFDGDGGLWFVNTRFGCLSTVSSSFSFEPQWHPPFISELVPEDRCHLNGMAFYQGRPKYVTTLSQTDEREGWRKALPNTGTMIDVETNEILLSELPMPHSPLIVDDRVYVLLSATGELAVYDPQIGKMEVVRKIGGFVRGMAYFRSHLFIAHSKLRKNSSTFRDLPIADEANEAGIAIVHAPTGALVGRIVYQQSVDEIFDVCILQDELRPGIVGLDRPERALAITTPKKSYWIAPRKKHKGETNNAFQASE